MRHRVAAHTGARAAAPELADHADLGHAARSTRGTCAARPARAVAARAALRNAALPPHMPPHIL
eukprot:5195686-Prymnesium_polylepis.1